MVIIFLKCFFIAIMYTITLFGEFMFFKVIYVVGKDYGVKFLEDWIPRGFLTLKSLD